MSYSDGVKLYLHVMVRAIVGVGVGVLFLRWFQYPVGVRTGLYDCVGIMCSSVLHA